MIRFITSFISFSFIIALPALALGYTDYAGLVLPCFWYMYLFFFVLTLVICAVVIIGQQRNSKMGAQMFLIATVVKLLLCMTFAVVYIQLVPIGGYRFVVSFFYLYFLNSAFEIYTLLSNLRVQNKK